MPQGFHYYISLHQFHLIFERAMLVFLVIFSSFLQSDEIEAPSFEQPLVELNLLAAVSLAVKNHPSIRAKRSEVAAARSDLSAAKWSTFPELSFSSQAVYNNENTRVVTLSQPIWTGGQVSAGIELAEASVDVAQGEMGAQQSEIIKDAVAAFFNVVAADKKLSIYRSNIHEHERLVGIITRRSSAQTSPEVDVMLARARLAQAISQEAQIKTNLYVAQAELEQLLGQQIDSVRFGGNEERFFDPLSRPLVDLEAQAINYSPYLDVLTASVSRADANVRLARAEGRPKVALGYEKRYGEVLFGQEREQIYLGLNYQPGAGLSSARRLTSAKSRRQSAVMDRVAAERELRRDLQMLLMQHQSAKNQIKTSKDLVLATQEVVSSYLRQYSVGRKSWLDALNAQRESVQARDALINFELSYSRSGIQLMVLLGLIDGGITKLELIK